MTGFILKSFKLLLLVVALLALSCGSNRSSGKFGEDFPWLWTVGLQPTEQAAFEVESKRGAVLVRYESPEAIEILPGCGEFGEYEFIESTKSVQKTLIANVEDIYAKFPIGASDLAKRYSDGDIWALNYMIIGMSTVTVSEDELDELEGNCERATHYVRSMAVGAFELADENAAVDSEQSATDAGARELNAGKAGVIESGGDFRACSSDKVLAGDPACRAIIRLYLEPL